MNEWLDKVSHFLGENPGVLPLVGLGLIILNFVFQLFPPNWFAEVNLFLHLGLVISLVGLLLIRPLQ